MSEQNYVLDADSFIRSKREHYAFDFCPGYWDALLKHFNFNRLNSIIPVRKELLQGKDALADWVKNSVPDNFFKRADDLAVQENYSRVIQTVQDNDQYSVGAKQKFANGADPWLIAYAAAQGINVVSYEVSSPDSKAIIKLPDIARHFDVKCIPPYVMLRKLQVKLGLVK